jgi:multiple sugar transport system substrate-binding protein
MFPVPALSNETATTMGGWLLSIPTSSKNKDLIWELITIIMEPRILAPWLERYGYLPTDTNWAENYACRQSDVVPLL